jgi:hypothetical protein
MLSSQGQHTIAMFIVHKYQIHEINYSERYCPANWRSDTRIIRTTVINWRLVTHAPKFEWPDNTFRHWLDKIRDYTLRVFLMQGLTSNMERSMKNVLNLLGTEMGRIRELTTLSQKI